MAGYTRQSIASIINGSNITAPPINAEFDQIQTAFAATGGHTHDGTSSGAGPKINLTTSISNILPLANGGFAGIHKTDATSNPVITSDASQNYAKGSLWLNTSTNTLFICLSATTNAALWVQVNLYSTSNHIVPATTNVSDLGTSTVKFKDLHLEGTANATTFAGNVTGNVTGNVAGDLTGDIKSPNGTVVFQNGTDGTDASFTGSITGSVTGNITGDVTGNITSGGTSSFNNITASGGITSSGTITGGTISTGDLASSGTSTFNNVTASGTITGTLHANNSIVSNVATPSVGTDGANKQYVLDQLNLGVNSVEAFRADSQLFAINPEDSQFTTSTNVTGFSALHYAAKASASATSALGSENNAAGAAANAALAAATATSKVGLIGNALDSVDQRLIGVLI